MLAMLLDAPGRDLRRASAPVPRAGAGQVLLRVRACGVCRTDLHVVDGELPNPKLPLVPGHEIVGEVASRPRHDGLAPGIAWVCPGWLDLRDVPLLPGRPGKPLRPCAVHRL